MPKRSKAETKHTIEQILIEAQKQILEMGYDVMSYSSLSEATGISRTGISHHFPHKSDFLTQLEPKFASLLMEHLDFSCRDALRTSWLRALELPTFSGIVKLFFSICGSSQLDSAQYKTLGSLNAKASAELGEHGPSIIDTLLGRSAVLLFSQKPQAV